MTRAPFPTRQAPRLRHGAILLLAACLPFSISGSQLALGLLIALTAALAIHERRRPPVGGAAGWLLVGFLLWSIVAAPLSAHPGQAMSRLPEKYWVWLTFFAVLATLRRRATLVRALWLLVSVAGVVGLYGIAQHVFGDAVPRPLLPALKLPVTTAGATHAVGLFDHHLTYGNSLAMILLLGVGLAASRRTWQQRLLVAGILAPAFLAFLWSFARSAWVGFFAGLLAFGALKGKRVLAGALAAVLLVGFAAYQLSPGLAERMERAVRSDKNLERLYTWKTTVDMIADHPVFGLGPGSYRSETAAYRAGYNIHWTATSHAHNSFLHFAAVSGVVAGVLFALFVVVLLSLGALRHPEVKQDLERRHLLAGAMAACTAFAVSSLLQHNAGDAEVNMLFQFAAAALIFLAGSDGAPHEEGDHDVE